MTEQELKEQREKLDLERTKFERERLEFEQKKLQRLTIAVSFVAVLVSALQLGIAFLQSKLTAAQTIEKFIPYLQKAETKDVAILVMQEFSDKELVTRLAGAVKATVALQEIKEQGTPEQKQQVTVVLDELAQKRASLIRRMFGPDKPDRIAATTELQREWRSDTRVVPEVVALAAQQPTNKSGAINALVLIRDFPTGVLRANAAEIEPFLDAVVNNGSQTEVFVRQVRDKLAASE